MKNSFATQVGRAIAPFLLSITLLAGPTTNSDTRVVQSHGPLPIAFEPNRGQTDATVKFLARVSGSTIFLTADEAVVRFANSVVRMKILNASHSVVIEGENQLSGTVNYYVGGKATPHLPTCAQVRYRNIYSLIDLVYYGSQQQLEYDFILRPGADPRKIELMFPGPGRVSLDRSNALVLRTPSGPLRHRAPSIYQESGGARRPVQSGYKITGRNTVAFQIGPYNAALPLVIDPVLAYSTYLSGSNPDQVWDLTVDRYGSVYITGSTTSPDFPVSHAVQSFRGSRTFSWRSSPLMAARLFIPPSWAWARARVIPATAIKVDAAGNAYITGSTSEVMLLGYPHRAFVAKLNADGSLAFFNSVTHQTSDAQETPAEIALDAQGNIYIAGTASLDTTDRQRLPGATARILERLPGGHGPERADNPLFHVHRRRHDSRQQPRDRPERVRLRSRNHDANGRDAQCVSAAERGGRGCVRGED
jgi:hypothetical protein